MAFAPRAGAAVARVRLEMPRSCSLRGAGCHGSITACPAATVAGGSGPAAPNKEDDVELPSSTRELPVPRRTTQPARSRTALTRRFDSHGGREQGAPRKLVL